ncbi:MAG: helix-turn-helix transcriptional regulator, partial [Spirochaetia bacterium]|nr:helix-turn-helix transcriptional regulator [Spirochaetia bacterium]
GAFDFYGSKKLPLTKHLSPVETQVHQNKIETILASAKSALALEWFLSGLFLNPGLRPDQSSQTKTPGKVPDWIGECAEKIQRPDVFRRGTHALVELTGLSPAHLSREIKKQLGLTPTDWINVSRLDFAARQLQLGEEPIVDISTDCGFESLAYFYKLFQKKYGQTPQAYRMRARKIFGMV